jgi:hypothetical protein
MPPGCTPEHCAMKSDRQADLTALFCSSVGACAKANPQKRPAAQKTPSCDKPNENQRPLRVADREDAYFRIVPSLESSSIYGMKTIVPAE